MILHIEKSERNRLVLRIEDDRFTSDVLPLRSGFKRELLSELGYHLFHSEYSAVIDDPAVKGAMDMVHSAE
ncbi:MAG: hypothetical protein JW821_08375 [Deltaproteobacteria bacterium]|nr:hypothetical protein [Deltaproteobacteria bacterium]